MAVLTFTDADGTHEVRSRFPAPGNRFANWQCVEQSVGATVERMSDGAAVHWRFRWQRGALFELAGIYAGNDGGINFYAAACRLIPHLLTGGTVTVDPEATGVTAWTCRLMPGTEPSLTYDRARFEYTLTLGVITTNGGRMPHPYARAIG